MRKITDNVLFVVGLVVISIILLFVTNAFAGVETVKDDNDGNKGYILINTGEQNGKSDVGHWTDITTILELKGEKGDKGDTGANGINGYTPIKNIDYFDGLNGMNGLDGKDGLSIKGDKGDTGENGKDVDTTVITNLQNNIDTESNTRSSAVNVLQSNISNVDINSQGRDTRLQSNINSVNSRVDDVSNRVSALEKTQYVIRTELKFIREKHLEVGVYTELNIGRSKCSEVGLNIVIPIGTSYQDRENKKIINRLDRLEQKVGMATVIERTVDNKGRVKSISITEGQLVVGGQF